MTPKPNDPEANPSGFDSCDEGLFLIHKDFLSQIGDGIKAAVQATGPGKGDFMKFAVSADRKVGLMKPTLHIKRGPGKKEKFTFTLDLFIPPNKK